MDRMAHGTDRSTVTGDALAGTAVGAVDGCRRSPNAIARLRVQICGAVQGVGFRPFVYRLATELNLGGWVINATEGVVIEVEGPRELLARFLERLPAEQPSRAIVATCEVAWL